MDAQKHEIRLAKEENAKLIQNNIAFNARIKNLQVKMNKQENKINLVDNEKLNRSENKNARYSLSVNTNPRGAKVQIMNIVPVYYDGIKLKPGRYDIKVSKPTYIAWRKWIEITNKDIVLPVSLQKDMRKAKIFLSDEFYIDSEREKVGVEIH